MIITDCVVEHNGAFEGSGLLSASGTVRISKSRFANNGATDGAVTLFGGTASIDGTTFEGNLGDSAGAVVIQSVERCDHEQRVHRKPV